MLGYLRNRYWHNRTVSLFYNGNSLGLITVPRLADIETVKSIAFAKIINLGNNKPLSVVDYNGDSIHIVG